MSSRADLLDKERERLDKALKILASATSYGIYAEMNREEAEEMVRVTCHGIDPEAIHVPGCASRCAGRILLSPVRFSDYGRGAPHAGPIGALHLTRLGGTYAMEDTDSMAIVATEAWRDDSLPRRPVSNKGRATTRSKHCHGNRLRRYPSRFAALSPYDRGAIPGSILKIEEDNSTPQPAGSGSFTALAISAKRYALFLRDDERRSCPARKKA